MAADDRSGSALPLELWHEVILRLDVRDVLALRGCSRWFRALTGDAVLWQKLCERDFDGWAHYPGVPVDAVSSEAHYRLLRSSGGVSQLLAGSLFLATHALCSVMPLFSRGRAALWELCDNGDLQMSFFVGLGSEMFQWQPVLRLGADLARSAALCTCLDEGLGVNSPVDFKDVVASWHVRPALCGGRELASMQLAIEKWSLTRISNCADVLSRHAVDAARDAGLVRPEVVAAALACCGLVTAVYGTHGLELLEVQLRSCRDVAAMPCMASFAGERDELLQCPAGAVELIGLKVFGDSNVPTGQVSFRVRLHSELFEAAATAEPRVSELHHPAFGQIAGSGYHEPRFIAAMASLGPVQPTGRAALRVFFLGLDVLEFEPLGLPGDSPRCLLAELGQRANAVALA